MKEDEANATQRQMPFPRVERHRLSRLRLALALFGAFASTGTASAQPAAEGRETSEMIATANRHFKLGRTTSRCSAPSVNAEIVVCGRRAPDPRYAPPEPLASPDMKTVALGAPPMGKGVGAGVAMRGCFLQKCPKELYFIDLKAIPEAPPGSDADRIAKGEVRAP